MEKPQMNDPSKAKQELLEKVLHPLENPGTGKIGRRAQAGGEDTKGKQ